MLFYMTADRLDTIARVLRDTIMEKPLETSGWDICGPNWRRDANKFMSALALKGLEIVEIKSKPKSKPAETAEV
jgi:hypothetical protein